MTARTSTRLAGTEKLIMPVEPASQDGSTGVEEVLNALSGSHTLDLLGLTDEDLQAARNDSELFETLRITHDLLVALRVNGVLGTFLSLPKREQINFIRWVGAIDAENLRQGRTETFIVALQEAPLADNAAIRRY